MMLSAHDLFAILPELLVIFAACAVLVLDPITPSSRKDGLAWLSLGTMAVCMGLTAARFGSPTTAFGGLVVIDNYSCFWKLLLYFVTGLTILLSFSYLKEERICLGEYYGFILLALSGMMVMVSGADLLTIYLGTELMSLSLYVMAGLKRAEAKSLEASAKYFVLGAFSSGILLYGISLLYGSAGSTAFGIKKNMWAPAEVGRNFDLSPSSLLPLEPFRDYLTVVSNTDVRNAEAFTLPEIGADHFRSSAVFLTQMHPKQTQGSDLHVGISLDQYYAQRYGQETPLPSMQLCIENVDQSGGCFYGYSCAYTDSISWASPNEPLPMIRDPRVAFDMLFGTGGGQTNPPSIAGEITPSEIRKLAGPTRLRRLYRHDAGFGHPDRARPERRQGLLLGGLAAVVGAFAGYFGRWLNTVLGPNMLGSDGAHHRRQPLARAVWRWR